jgi:hypothetical protein
MVSENPVGTYQFATAEIGTYAKIDDGGDPTSAAEVRYEMVVGWRLNTVTGDVEPVTVCDVGSEFHDAAMVDGMCLSKDIPQDARTAHRVVTGWGVED